MAEKLAPEGTVIRMGNGEMRVKRGGQWVPQAVGQNGFTSSSPLRAPDPVAQRNVFSKDYDVLRGDRERLGRFYPTVSQLDRFENINLQQPTGGFQHRDMSGWVKPVVELFNPKLQDMAGISSILQGQARPVGSGATSDFEQRLYRQGVPSPEKEGPNNQSIIAYQKGVLYEERDRLAFSEAFLNQNGSLAGSQEAWTNYVMANPYTVMDQKSRTRLNNKRQNWDEYFGVRGAARPAATVAPAPVAAPRKPPPAPKPLAKGEFKVRGVK